MSVPTPLLLFNLSDATMKGLLPAGYTPLVYIETTGTQLINTGVSINNNIKLIGKWGSLVWASGGYNLLYGANSGANTLTAWCAPSGYNWRWGGLAPSSLPVWNLADINYTEQSKDGIRINGTLVSTYSGTPSFNNQTIYLFGDTGSSYYLTGRCYYFKIWDNNSLAVDLHPARRDSDGVIGMYDLVSRTFKTNSGSGTFIAGPELAIGKNGGKSLPEEYLLVEYLESTGTLYINTGHVATNSTSTTCMFLYVNYNSSNSGYADLFGKTYPSSVPKSYMFRVNSSSSFNALRAVSINCGTADLNKHTILISSGDTKLDGVSKSTDTTSLTDNAINSYLFCSNNNGNTFGMCNARIFYYLVKDSSSPVRNMIPCYRKSDMKPGMYDVVNGVFYTNAGSGEFILGPSITNTYTYEPNAGSGTLLGFYTNLSGIYDSSKGWVAGFNGSNYISTPGFSQNDIKSIALWVKAPNLNNLVWYCDAKAKTGLGIHSSSFIIGSRGRSLPVFGLNGFTANTWYHIVVVYNSTPELYINGVKYTGSGGNEWSSDDNNLMLIGTRLYSGALHLPFSGQISNFMVFNTALTAAQVKELYGK